MSGLPRGGCRVRWQLASGGQLAFGGLPAAGGVSGPDLWADGQYAAQVIAEPVRGDQTAAGLPVRVPRANLLPGSAGGGRPAGHGLASRQAGGAQGQGSGGTEIT